MDKRVFRFLCLSLAGIMLGGLQSSFSVFAKPQTAETKPIAERTPVPGGIVFDNYPFNFYKYDSCYPQIDMATAVLVNNPSAICLIEGFRDRKEKRWVSKRRSEHAKWFLVEYKKIAPERILTQDRGFERLPKRLPGTFRSEENNRRIVISVYLPLDWKARKETQMLPYIYDGYTRNYVRYNTCYPQLDMAISEMKEDPNLFCVIEGHRETNEKKAISVVRAKMAESHLHAFGSIDQSRTRFIDAGFDDRLWLDPTGNVPRPFLGHTNRFIAIGLFHPVAISGFQ